jgi:hypothetical protein
LNQQDVKEQNSRKIKNEKSKFKGLTRPVS